MLHGEIIVYQAQGKNTGATRILSNAAEPHKLFIDLHHTAHKVGKCLIETLMISSAEDGGKKLELC